MEGTDQPVEPGGLVICGACHSLRGPVPGRTDGARQLCACACSKQRDAQPLWGGDFNTYAELCRCCGLVLLPSGSRWSVWFCRPCLRLIRALNERLGYAAVPVGRHSIMNEVSLPGSALDDPDAVTDLATDLDALSARIITLRRYAVVVVERNLAAIGRNPAKDLRLSRYLTRVAEVDLSPEGAFVALLFDLAPA